MNIRDAIFGSNKLKFVDIVVPEWDNVTVRIQETSVEDAFIYNSLPEMGEGNRLIFASLRDIEGNRVFSMDDIESFKRLPSALINKLFKEYLKFFNIEAEDTDPNA
jgi:hypothetical protein